MAFFGSLEKLCFSPPPSKTISLQMVFLPVKPNQNRSDLQPMVFKWTCDEDKLFQNHGSQAVWDALQKWNQRTNANMMLEVSYINWINSRLSPTWSTISIGSIWLLSWWTPVLMIIWTIVVLIIGFIIYHHKCSKPHPTQDIPTQLTNPVFQAAAPPSVTQQQKFVKCIT